VKQAQFEHQGAARWDDFETLLTALESGNGERAAEFPHLYRRICQDLALARDRQLSRPLVERLNHMALRGHEHLYQARRFSMRGALQFVSRDFPRAVRSEWRLVLFTSVLFYGLALGIALMVQQQPELVYSFLDPGTIADLETAYDPSDGRIGQPRDAEDDVAMFGFYIWNNISIAFRAFASGLIFGIGTLVVLVFNGIYFGVVAGHLAHVGFGTSLASFVIAHGAFELTAILFSGVAGMRLGLALVAPGPRSRLQALRDASQRALPLVYGAGGMLVIAALIEAFWSPRPLPPELKYSVGAVLWALVALYLLFAGRRRAD